MVYLAMNYTSTEVQKVFRFRCNVVCFKFRNWKEHLSEKAICTVSSTALTGLTLMGSKVCIKHCVRSWLLATKIYKSKFFFYFEKSVATLSITQITWTPKFIDQWHVCILQAQRVIRSQLLNGESPFRPDRIVINQSFNFIFLFVIL